MPSRDRRLSLAIIGAGPRALAAIEALADRLDGTPRRLDLVIFDPHSPPATGPNFDPAADPLELLNLPLRAVDLPLARGGFPPFADWLATTDAGPAADFAADDFPPRACLGAYLSARWRHLEDRLLGAGHSLSLHPLPVTRLLPCASGWMAATPGGTLGPYSEVLLTLGQPQSRPDAQMRRWARHAAQHGLALLPVYPTASLRQAVPDWRNLTVAIRGLGLSTFDAVRALTLGCGGRMRGGRYERSGAEPRIVPFSLDGRPPAPKPETAELDEAFAPSDAARADFRQALHDCCAGGGDPALRPLRRALAPMAEAVLAARGASAGVLQPDRWLELELDAPGSPENDDALDFLKSTLDMAMGQTAPSTGFAIGQIWRHLQPDLREIFYDLAPAPPMASTLIALDEGLKRYSYGPPVRAAQELLALVEAGVVTLRATADPDIGLTPQGWCLDPDGGAPVVADVMLDAVLPGPDLDRLAEPLLVDLLAADLLAPMGEGLGLNLGRDAQALSADGSPVRGLSVLGRMTTGRTIAVDSIHDCFGPATRAWADRLACD